MTMPIVSVENTRKPLHFMTKMVSMSIHVCPVYLKQERTLGVHIAPPMRITKMPIGSVRNAHKPLHFMTEIIDMSKTIDACDMTHIHVFYI